MANRSRVCPRCDKARVLSSYSVVSQGQGWKAHDGTYRYSYCKFCNRARVKRYYSDEEKREARKHYMRRYYAERKNDPAFIEEQRARRRTPRAQELMAARRERYFKRIRSSPALLEDLREKQRLWAWEGRRRRGVPERPILTGPKAPDNESDQRLPRGPFAEWLEKKEAEYGTETLAELIGLSARGILRIRRGDVGHERVSIDTIDRALTNEGSTSLWELYPSEEAMVA